MLSTPGWGFMETRLQVTTDVQLKHGLENLDLGTRELIKLAVSAH